MAPKVSQTQGGGGGGGGGVGVGAPKVFKKKARRIVAYHWGRALLENATFAQIQEIPATFSIHGLFGKKICKHFKGPAWDSTIFSEYFKFCLRERWANCEPNNVRTDPKKHLDHHTKLWNKEYSKHVPELMMSQKEYVVYTVNKFNSARVKLNSALNESCRGQPVDLSSGRRKMDIDIFLDLLKKDGLVPSIHVRKIKKLDIQLLTEVRFYYHPGTDDPIDPPTYTKKDEGYCDFSKPLYVV